MWKMSLIPLESDHVKAFLPANTWTKVILLSQTPVSNDVYACTTEEKIKEKVKIMNMLSNDIEKFDKIEKFNFNELVAVEIDGKWSRGRLISYNEFLPDNKKTTIELIDDGFCHETSFENIFLLPYFHRFKPLALLIKFQNYVPKTRTLTVKPLFSESLLSKGYVVVDIQLQELHQELQDTTKKNEKLTEHSSANGIDVQSITNGFDSTCSIQSRIKHYSANALPSLRKGGFPTRQLKLEKDLPFKNGDYCLLVYIENFMNIYVYPAEKNDKNNLKQNEENILNKTASSKDFIPKICPRVGDIVKVKSPSFDMQAYRSKILNKSKDDQYDVFYIDFGNIENVPSDVIFELDETLKNLPGIAIKVGMSDLKHIKFTEELKKVFDEIYGQLLVIEFDEENLDNVKLKFVFDETYINDIFIQKKPDFTNAIQGSKTTILTNDKEIKQFSNLKSKDSVYLKHFESMESVYVLRATDVKFFNEMLMRIYDENSKLKKDLILGDIVKVIIPENGQYRAKIVKIGLSLITVLSIDFGYEETVKSFNIYELPDDLQKIPGLLFKIGIKEPVLKKTKALTDFVQDHEKILLCLEFDENDTNGCENSTLRRIDNSENIFDEFLRTIEETLALNGILSEDQNNEVLNVKDNIIDDFQSVDLENGDYCILSHFESFKSIYVCKAIKDLDNSYSAHNVDIILKTLGSEDQEVKTNLSVGDYVKVRSPNFKDFYRAKIISIKNNTEFHVSYIDFGNEETVQSSDIFELSDELKIKTKLPLRVSIDVPSNAKKTDEIRSLFTNLIDNCVVCSINFESKNSDGLVNVILEEIESGKSVNKEILKLLPIENKITLKNGDNCVLTRFQDFNCIYVHQYEKNASNIALDTTRSTDEHHKTKVPQDNNETAVNEELRKNSFESELTLNVELKSGDIVFCCNFEDFNTVYVCKRSKNDDRPENCKVIIHTSKVNDTLKKKNPHCEDLVRVKFEDTFFRARVIDKFDESYTVLLIDIGKKIKILGDHIYELPDNLKNIPCLAKKVGLKGVQGMHVTTTVIDYFHRLWHTDKIPLILTYDEDNFNYMNEVSLKKLNDGRDVIEDLVNISKLSSPQTNHETLAVEKIMKVNGSPNNNWRIVNGDLVEFLVGYNVDNISIRCVRIFENFKDSLEQLKQEKKENLKMKAGPYTRDIVAVYSCKLKGVFRAVVLTNDSLDKVKCRLIDNGIIELIPSQYLFELPNDYASNKIPLLSHKVALKGLNRNSGYSTTELNSYLSTMIGKTFVLEFDKNEWQWNSQVVLKELYSDVSLNDEIKKKIPIIPVSQRLEKKIIVIDKNVNETKNKYHPIESGSLVVITHFEDFNSIFVRSASVDCATKFAKLYKKMLTLYRNATNNCSTKTLNIEDKVCVKSCTNNTIFCRARIINKFGLEYNVFLVDFGNTELVSAEDIFELSKELQEIPDFAIEVQFKNVPPTLTKNVCQAVKEYVKKKYIIPNVVLKIEFNEAIPEGLNDVILKTDVTYKDVADDLIKLFNDPPLLNIKTTGNTQGGMKELQRPPNSPYLARKNFK